MLAELMPREAEDAGCSRCSWSPTRGGRPGPTQVAGWY
jgi:hypothetical protein